MQVCQNNELFMLHQFIEWKVQSKIFVLINVAVVAVVVAVVFMMMMIVIIIVIINIIITIILLLLLLLSSFVLYLWYFNFEIRLSHLV